MQGQLMTFADTFIALDNQDMSYLGDHTIHSHVVAWDLALSLIGKVIGLLQIVLQFRIFEGLG